MSRSLSKKLDPSNISYYLQRKSADIKQSSGNEDGQSGTEVKRPRFAMKKYQSPVLVLWLLVTLVALVVWNTVTILVAIAVGVIAFALRLHWSGNRNDPGFVGILPAITVCLLVSGLTVQVLNLSVTVGMFTWAHVTGGLTAIGFVVWLLAPDIRRWL